MSEEAKIDGIIEIVIAIVLGVGAILGAYSSFQASLYGSKMDQSYNEALQSFIDASVSVTVSSSEMVSDMLAYMEIKRNEIGYEFGGEDETYYDKMAEDALPYITSQSLYDAIIWADEMNESDPDGPHDDGEPYSFYDHEQYSKASDGWYEESVNDAMDKFDEGNEFNTLGDYHEQYTSIIAVALFLCGISAVIKGRKIKITLNVMSGVILVVCAILIVQIPIVLP